MKPLCVISAPVDTHSGYGARSRDLIKALYDLKKDEWDIRILSQMWGNTSWGYIKENKDKWGFLESLILPNNQLTVQPDYWFQVTIPNEFQKVGKLMSIGVTAGIETTVCDPSWIEGVNRMDKVWVSSEHAKKVFQTSSFEQKNQQGQTIKAIKLEKPVEVLFEGADLSTYFYMKSGDLPDTKFVLSLDEVEEDFNFLFVGHWIGGAYGQDRKNVSGTIGMFLEAFKGKKGAPGLILKTTSVGNSIMDRDQILEKIDEIRKGFGNEKLPNIYLLHGDLAEEDMNHLYNHPNVSAMIYFGHGEGFGRPLLEFSLCKKPMIVSGWSGQLDFLNPEFTSMISGELRPIHPSAHVPNMLLNESSWFYANEKQCMETMKAVYEDYQKYESLAKRQSHYNKENFSLEKMKDKIESLVKDFPKMTQIKLPTLKKIELPKLNPIK
jgi:glycosyltransferase involved in cell wall biosynthesis